MHLTQLFPDPRIREAYLSPVVDDSPEPFKWALPDINALQSYLNSRLSWSIPKCNEILMPVIKRVTQARALAETGEARAQTTLDGFVTKAKLPDIAKNSGGRHNSKRVAQAVSRLRGGEPNPVTTASAPQAPKTKRKRSTKIAATDVDTTAAPPKRKRKSKKMDKAEANEEHTVVSDAPSIPSDTDLPLFEEMEKIERAHASIL